MQRIPRFDPTKLEPLRWKGAINGSLNMISHAGEWKFRLRTRPLSIGESELLGALSHMAGALAGIKHWAVELMNEHTGESFLFELKKIEDLRNELAVYHLHAGAPGQILGEHDSWREYGFDVSRFVFGKVREGIDPKHVYTLASNLMHKHPEYCLLVSDCIAFATSLMQNISASENIEVSLRQLLGSDPHKELPTLARVFSRILFIICPTLYAIAAIPRAQRAENSMEVFVELVQAHLQATIGYCLAEELACGLGWTGRRLIGYGRDFKTQIAGIEGIEEVIACLKHHINLDIYITRRARTLAGDEENSNEQTALTLPYQDMLRGPLSRPCRCDLIHFIPLNEASNWYLVEVNDQPDTDETWDWKINFDPWEGCIDPSTPHNLSGNSEPESTFDPWEPSSLQVSRSTTPLASLSSKGSFDPWEGS